MKHAMQFYFKLCFIYFIIQFLGIKPGALYGLPSFDSVSEKEADLA